MRNGSVCLGSLTKLIAMILIWTCCKQVMARIRWLEMEIERNGLGFFFWQLYGSPCVAILFSVFIVI